MNEGEKVMVEWGTEKHEAILLQLYKTSADVRLDNGKIVNFELCYVHTKNID